MSRFFSTEQMEMSRGTFSFKQVRFAMYAYYSNTPIVETNVPTHVEVEKKSPAFNVPAMYVQPVQ